MSNLGGRLQGGIQDKCGLIDLSHIIELLGRRAVARTGTYGWCRVIVCRTGGMGGGSVRTVSRNGVWVQKPGCVSCKCSHGVTGEQALQREDVMEMRPSREGMVE